MPHSVHTRSDTVQPRPAAAASRGRWTYRLGRWLGIDVYVHATFLALLAFFGLRAGLSGGAGAGLEQVAWMVALFGSVVLHEYGHALAARSFGIGTQDITLYPIGGVARLNAMPRSPGAELIVAAAGPLVNMALAFVFALGHTLSADAGQGAFNAAGELAWPLQFAVMNLGLGIFNLVPAFPMDGGRILRALLATLGNRVRATVWAARVGRVLALGFVVAGLFGNPMLMLLGAFVWFGAGAEAGAAVREEQLLGASVQQAMSRRFLTLSPWTQLGELAQRELDMTLLEDGVFPVESGGAVVGIVTAEALRDGLHDLGPKGYVADVMTRDILCVRPSDELSGTLRALHGRTLAAAPVVMAGRLVGMLTPRGVAAFMGGPQLRHA
ncbi:MAG: site-2 protease family protein [Myxococcales bacterium]|nr:site-2 protease family protein [Myxococcales bacterium]MCB9625763.1 site-2 protease family protein [Sandaracinaceae bacterium]